MKRIRASLPLLVAALIPGLALASAESSQSTISVYVPGYKSENWDDLAGSIITSDSTATTYTIFCPNTADCEISGPLAFTFAEGPSTFSYSGSLESKLTAVISCDLASTTAATCTEYSSFGSGFTRGNTTGPTEVSRTETYSGSDVQWGVLTLTSSVPASTPAQTTSGDGTVTTVDPTDTAWFFPHATSSTSSSGAAPAAAVMRGGLSTVPAAAAALVVAGLVLAI